MCRRGKIHLFSYPSNDDCWTVICYAFHGKFQFILRAGKPEGVQSARYRVRFGIPAESHKVDLPKKRREVPPRAVVAKMIRGK
ncbi:hypothetical protein GCM10023191_005470 [Actinoallomurus oryzae]|uniref:Uncharacterized protein n=1 Tax=Actinoallomurus oryzae TaxID=502180 RepID=A0ABP8PBU0_9ACTN